MSEEISVALIGSGVIAAIVSGLFRLMDKRTDNISKHIVEQREKWREKLRDISVTIQTSDNLTELRRATTQLKTRINAYGQIKKSDTVITKYLHEDSHIWKVIDEVDRLDEPSKIFTLKRDKRLTPYKEKLVRYISILLKNDWERSKKEAITTSDYWAYFSSALIFTGLYALYQHFFVLNRQSFPSEVKLLFVLILLSIALLFVTKELLKKLIENNAFQDDYSAINVFMYFFLGLKMPKECGKTAKGYSIIFKAIAFIIVGMLFGFTAWISISQVLRMTSGSVIGPLLDMFVLLAIFLVPTTSWVVIIFKSINSYVCNNTKERTAIEEISKDSTKRKATKNLSKDSPDNGSEVTVYEKMSKIKNASFNYSEEKIVHYDNFLAYLKTNLIQTVTEAVLSVTIAAGFLLFVKPFLGTYLRISKAQLLSIFIAIFLVAILACLIHARTVINYSVDTVLDLSKKLKCRVYLNTKEIKVEMEKNCFRNIHLRGFIAYTIVGVLLSMVIWIYVSYTPLPPQSIHLTFKLFRLIIIPLPLSISSSLNYGNYVPIALLGPVFGFLWNFSDFHVNKSMDLTKIFNNSYSAISPHKPNVCGLVFTIFTNVALLGGTIALHLFCSYGEAVFQWNPTNLYFIYTAFLVFVFAFIYAIPKFRLFFKANASGKLYAFRNFDKKDTTQK